MSQTLGEAAGYVRHCDDCGDVFQTTDSPRDEHCSHRCYYRDRGDSALNVLRNTHSVCASCFRYIKECHRPSDDFLEDVSSLETRALEKGATITNDSEGEMVLDITSVDGSTRPPGLRKDGIQGEFCYIGRQYPTKHTRYLYGSSGPWVCECGNVDLQHHNEVLARQDYEAVTESLGRRLVEFYEKGALSHEPDLGVFFEYIEERETDISVATGAALYKQ